MFWVTDRKHGLDRSGGMDSEGEVDVCLKTCRDSGVDNAGGCRRGRGNMVSGVGLE